MSFSRRARIAALLILSLSAQIAAPVHAWADETSSPKPPKPSFALQVTEHGMDFAHDSVKFYMAVATVSYWECVRTKDPTTCENFVESLKDPGTHVGFALFVLTSQGVSHGMLKLSRGMFAGSSLAMASAVMVNDLFSDLYTNPTMHELLSLNSRMIKDPNARWAKRKELIGKLFDETVKAKAWWLDRVPNVMSLLGAMAVSPLILPASELSAAGLADLSRLTYKTERLAAALDKARVSIALYRNATKTGASLFRLLEMRNGYLFAIMSVGETIAFLNAADWFEQPIKKWWNESRAAKNLAQQKALLEWMLAQPRTAQSEQKISAQVIEVEKAWDEYRQSQFLEPKKIQAEYLKAMASLEKPLTETYLNYLWIIEGAPKKAENMKQAMPLDWEPGDPQDEVEYRERFFCGVAPEDAARAATHLNGILVPGLGDRVRPFHVASTPVHCPLLSAEEDLLGDYLRKRDIARHDYGHELDVAYAKAYAGFEQVRKEIYERYEHRIQSAAIQGLSGVDGEGAQFADYRFEPSAKSATPAQSFKRGILPSYLQELEYWKSLGLQDALERVERKKDAAKGLLAFMINPQNLSGFKSGESDDFKNLFEDDEPKTLEEWQQVVQNWKSFTLGQVNL